MFPPLEDRFRLGAEHLLMVVGDRSGLDRPED